MKNLKLFISLLIVIVFSVDLFPGVGGEIILHPINLNGNTTFNLHVYKSNDYAWLWDKDNSKVVYVSEYNQTWENLTINTYGFDEPRDAPGADRGTIPWGVINFVITSGYQTISFALDLRDYGWSQNQSKYWTHDTYINFDFSKNSGIVFLSQGAARNVYDPNDPEQIAITNSTQQIWSFWSPGSTPFQDYFTVPVTLVNEVENTSYHYGALYSNGQQIPTGGQDYLKLRSAQVSTYTDLINYNGNNYSFKWEHTNVTPLANIKIYNSYTLFNSTLDVINKEVKRIFRPVYPLTIKNSLDELGGISVDNVHFKDPTTTNNYEQKSASGNGFYKDNAFKELNIEVGDLQNQKYGAKAKSTIDYNGYKFQYSYGDFNTDGTDFLITAPTTKVAHFKGIQLSNTSFSDSKSRQRGFLKDNATADGYLHNVYESMNKIWYERSKDNGVNWELMNNGLPINPVGNAKSPSICENTTHDFLYIVYQCDTPPYDGLVVTQFRIAADIVMPAWNQPICNMSDYDYSNDYQSVISSMGDGGIVVCNPPSTSIAGLRAFNFTTDWVNHNFVDCSEFSIPSSQNSSNPSLAAGCSRTHLVFEEAKLSIKY